MELAILFMLEESIKHSDSQPGAKTHYIGETSQISITTNPSEIQTLDIALQTIFSLHFAVKYEHQLNS